MAMFKPLSDLTRTVTGLLQSVRGIAVTAGGEGMGQGLKGLVQGALDLNIEGLMDAADAQLGAGIMRLMLAGYERDVATAVRFRSYAFMRLEEVKQMRDMINHFISRDVEEVKEAAGEMDEFLASRETDSTCSEREELLRQEADKLRKLVGRMSRFLEDEERLLDGEAQPDGRQEDVRHELVPVRQGPTIVTGQDSQMFGEV